MNNWNDDEFDIFNMPESDQPTSDICPNCNISMQSRIGQYVCGQCGLIQYKNEDVDINSVSSSGVISIKSGKYTRKFHSSTHNTELNRINYTLMMLNKFQMNSPNFKIAPNLLHDVAVKFASIKIPDENEELKPLIKRGIFKRQLLVVMIYHMAISEYKVQYRRADIATWAGLSNDGLSKASTFLRNLHAKGYIDMTFDNETVFGYTNRYFEAIGIDNGDYIKFATELVEYTETKKILMTSKLSSKVAGALWIVITHCKLNFPASEVEKCSDNIKPATFKKFSKIVDTNIDKFAHIFNKYKIPLSVE